MINIHTTELVKELYHSEYLTFPTFEGILITARQFKVIAYEAPLKAEDLQSPAIARTSAERIDELLEPVFDTSRKVVRGNLCIAFRNQGKDNSLILELEGRFNLIGFAEEKDADVVYKTIQSLYDWLKVFVIENGVGDRNFEIFKVPPFYLEKDEVIKRFGND